MDPGVCWAVYLDDRVAVDRWLNDAADLDRFAAWPDLAANLACILAVARQVYVCNSGQEFAGKVAELSGPEAALVPVLAFIDIALCGDAESAHARRASLTLVPPASSAAPATSRRRSLAFSSESEDLFGLHLLSRFSADIHARETPHAILPVAVLRDTTAAPSVAASGRQVSRCLDAGAVDVLVSPVDAGRVQGLLTHAYRIRKAAQKESAAMQGQAPRKCSWVGVQTDAEDEPPYAYLREAMVSKLMKRICNPEEALDDSLVGDVCVSSSRKEDVRAAIADWHFCAHDFDDDELCYAACLMFEHTFRIPELRRWRIRGDDLRGFVLSCRAAYNSFILYHNFRHAVDVLQSTFHILTRIGAIPPLPRSPAANRSTHSGVSSLLTPFDALTLLITALGHDVGHPGVSNMFLIKLNAPLAQLYNDRSVLEAFHCAAYSQILRRHWPRVFEDTEMRTLMISSILATDMGIHNRFIEELGRIRTRFETEGRKMDEWVEKDIREYRVLLCALIIKCADISNVARPFIVAEQWTDALLQEFANQGEMETNIGIETTLFGGPPELGNFTKKAKGQIGFMDIFCLPLFDGITDILPDLAFAANNIRRNKFTWSKLIEHEDERAAHRARGCRTPRCTSPDTTWHDIRERLVREGPDAMGYTIHHRSPPHSPVRSPPQLDGTGSPAEQSTSTSANGNHRAAARSAAAGDGKGGGVRTQSASTHTNTTLITPLSSTTQASSISSLEEQRQSQNQTQSDDENNCKLYQHLDLTAGREQTVPASTTCSYTSSLTDPPANDTTSSNAPVDATDGAGDYRPPRWYDRGSSSSPTRGTGERRSRFIAGLFEKTNPTAASTSATAPDQAQDTRGRRAGPTSHPRSTPSSPPLPPFDSNTPSHAHIHAHPQAHSYANAHATMPLPRRKSRLRLAFWRRSKQPPAPGHPHSPPQSDSAPSTTASASSMLSSDHY